MHGDEPTVPNLRTDEAEHPEGTPRWPVASRRARDTSTGAMPTSGLVLVTSLLANVVLLALVAVLSFTLLVRSGYFAPPSSSAQPSEANVTSTPARAIPSPTPQTVPSPTTDAAVVGGLHVSPTTVNLGCGPGQQMQFVVLVNEGSEQVQWQADFSVPRDQAGIDITPDRGQLQAGTSVAIQLHNKSHDGQQGVIQFDSTAQGAGTPASLTYTTTACA